MNRRQSDHESNTKAAILKAISDCGDDNMRAILLLMLAVLEEIGSKIDAVMSDEKAIREIVLNGHTAVHDDDHEWIAQFRDTRPAGKCSYVLRMEQAEETAARSKRKVGEEVVSKVLVSALSILATLLLMGASKWMGL